jgi:hypothetical protein
MGVYGCPICGAEWCDGCPPSVLRAIDAANTRALREDDDDFNGLRMSEFHRSESLRLREGFAILSLTGD